jgi:hypothetical protein
MRKVSPPKQADTARIQCSITEQYIPGYRKYQGNLIFFTGRVSGAAGFVTKAMSS